MWGGEELGLLDPPVKRVEAGGREGRPYGTVRLLERAVPIQRS